jgi:TIGR03009 family protein
LQVSIYRIDKLPDWDEEIHYDGTAKFKTPQLAYLDFKKIKTKVVPDPADPKKNKVVDLIDPNSKTEPPTRLSDPYERIVCTGKEIWHYRFDKKTATIFPLNKQAQRRALDEGPLPFLFNMKVDDALARYQMSLQGENAKTYFVVIKPKLKEDKESFSTAWVWLDRKYLLPVRIALLSPDNTSMRDFKLSRIAANQDVENEVFRGGKFPGWTVERNPTAPEDGQANRPAPRRDSTGQAAQRPRSFDRDGPR